MIPPGFAVLNRLLLQTGKICLLAGMIAVTVEIAYLF
jgi:hypothetical protein